MKEKVGTFNCLEVVIIIIWFAGAVIVGLGAWEKGQSIIISIGIGLCWPLYLPFMVLMFLKDAL